MRALARLVIFTLIFAIAVLVLDLVVDWLGYR